VEAGEDELAERASMVYLGPLDAAVGLAFMIVPGGYNAWPGRESCAAGVTLVLLCAFLAHAVATLTRKTRRRFFFWTAVQILFLTASVISVLYYWQWDSDHLHG
jgi:drug/metabolite transporter (DMT)-like permease